MASDGVAELILCVRLTDLFLSWSGRDCVYRNCAEGGRGLGMWRDRLYGMEGVHGLFREHGVEAAEVLGFEDRCGCGSATMRLVSAGPSGLGHR